jgi:hypothetical protein
MLYQLEEGPFSLKEDNTVQLGYLIQDLLVAKAWVVPANGHMAVYVPRPEKRGKVGVFWKVVLEDERETQKHRLIPPDKPKYLVGSLSDIDDPNVVSVFDKYGTHVSKTKVTLVLETYQHNRFRWAWHKGRVA